MTNQIDAGDVNGDGAADLLVTGQEQITGGHRTRAGTAGTALLGRFPIMDRPAG